MDVTARLISIDGNIVYISESISYIAVKDLNRVSVIGYEDIDLEHDLISLRHYLMIIQNFKLYLQTYNEEPKWDINIRTIIEQSYNIIVKYLGMKHQWSNNDN